MPLVETERRKIRALADALHAGELSGHTGPADHRCRQHRHRRLGSRHRDGGARRSRSSGRSRTWACTSSRTSTASRCSTCSTRVDPETTLFVICSKTFTTLETLTNAQAVREWLLEHGGNAAVAAQCVAVSTNTEAMDEFGIAPDRRLAMWDWVGGRYSVWSAVGLTVALAVGWENFAAILAGGHAIDEHFERQTNRGELAGAARARRDLESELPPDADARGAAVRRSSRAVSGVPPAARDGEQRQVRAPRRRARRVRDLPDRSGASPGRTRSTPFISCCTKARSGASIDFLLPARSAVGRQAQQDLAAANCLAQAWALAVGDPSEQPGSGRSPHQHYPGSRAELAAAVRASRSRDARQAGGALRAQGVRAGRDLGRELVRSVGGAAREAARVGARRRGREGGRKA